MRKHSLKGIILYEQNSNIISTEIVTLPKSYNEDIDSFGLSVDYKKAHEDEDGNEWIEYEISGPQENVDRFLIHVQGIEKIRKSNMRDIIPVGSGGYSASGVW